MKTSLLAIANDPDGTEEIPVLQGAGLGRSLKRMPAAALAQAGTRPTPAELQAAIIATLLEGDGIAFVTDAEAGTIVIGIDAAALASSAELAAGLATKQASSAILSALAALAIAGQAGKVVKVNPAGDGFVLAADDTAAGGGSGLTDGDKGDVAISGGGTVMTVQSAAGGLTVPDEPYGPAWDASTNVPTKNALFDKLELLTALIAGKIASSAIGQANGVASLDATGKVPAVQLPSFVDDVLEYPSAAAFPAVGEAGKIYIALDNNSQWRWAGSTYQTITASPGTSDNVTEGVANLYFTDLRVRSAAMTGLTDTAGTPAESDSLLAILGKIKKALFTDLPATIRGVALTGLTDTAGTPAAGDTLLAALGKIRKGFFTDHAGANGAVHAVAAAGGNAGFMSGADKAKLDGIAAAATANPEPTNAEFWTGTDTGKAITPRRLFGGAAEVAVAYAATVTLNGNAGLNFAIGQLTGPLTLANPTNMKAGQSGLIFIPQDATGGRAITYGSAWKFPGGAAGGTLSAAPSAEDAISYFVRADGTIRCTLVKAFG